MKRVLITICGRAGSKGFKNKNLKTFLEKPLVYYTLASAFNFKDTVEGEEIKIDYGVCNGMRFINCLCMGIDADVNARVCEVGKSSMVPKKMLYISSALKVIQHLNPLKFTAWIDGVEAQKEGLLAAVMNGRKYGGGFTPTPDSDFNDGEFPDMVQLYFIADGYADFVGNHRSLYFIESHGEYASCRMCDRGFGAYVSRIRVPRGCQGPE